MTARSPAPIAAKYAWTLPATTCSTLVGDAGCALATPDIMNPLSTTTTITREYRRGQFRALKRDP